MNEQRKGPTILVNSYSERWLRKGFPWVYPKEIVRGKAKPGKWVSVRSQGGALLGQGLFDRGWIAVRLMPEDLVETLEQAAALRRTVIDDSTTAYRLVHGENDGVPGVRVDIWGEYAVLALDSPSLAPLVPQLADWLIHSGRAKGVYLCYRPDPRDKSINADEVNPQPGLVGGIGTGEDIVVLERGVKVLVRPFEGPDVGLYADMRDVRSWMEPHWRGRRVLNTFAYTGVFSLVSAIHGAAQVSTVDLSGAVLDRARANFAVNGLNEEHFEFIAADTFKALDRWRRKGRKCDLVILDPPSFSRGSAGIFNVRKDYSRLVAGACRVLDHDGWLLCASNLGQVSPREFRKQVGEGFARSKVRGQEIHWATAAPDFPAAAWFPEGNYLKVGLWRILH
ncbi:MAG: class I SAM-dependent rRNA methyltransferase [Proteobacteria bacterium]|nr:class I SAM-dependent rRNA methyltransferase [Pseudomonadota bacterium]